MRRLLRNRRGASLPLFAAALPVLIGAGALAVDMGSMQLDARRLQGIADAAALAAATRPGDVQGAAEAIVARSAFPRAITVRAVAGRYRDDPALAQDQRFVAGAATPNGARVTLETTTPTFLAAIFGQRTVAVSRQATATNRDYAAFSIGTRLAAIDGGVANKLLSALTGGSVALSVMDYRALASADVDLGQVLATLRTRGTLRAGTVGEALSASVSSTDFLAALAQTLGSGTPAGAAVAALANSAVARTIPLDRLVSAGPLAQAALGPIGARVDALSLVEAALQIGNGNRPLTLDLGATIPGLTQTTATVAVGERQAQSPWLTVTDNGDPIISTAQARVALRARVAPQFLPLLGTVALDVPVAVELAGGQARLSAVRCNAGEARSVTLDGRTSPARASLGVPSDTFADFRTPLTVTPARMVDTALIDVIASGDTNFGAAEPWQSVRFDQAAIDTGAIRTISSSTPIGSLAASLLARPTLRVETLLFGLDLGIISTAIGGALTPVAPLLDSLLATVTGLAGVGIGQADLRVTGMRCGMPVLVA